MKYTASSGEERADERSGKERLKCWDLNHYLKKNKEKSIDGSLAFPLLFF
jgi:hypothetical protein